MAICTQRCIWKWIKRNKKGKIMALFQLGGFFRVSSFTGSTSRCNDFDGHLMVSKMVIEFFSRPYNNWITTVYLTQANVLALRGLRIKIMLILSDQSMHAQDTNLLHISSWRVIHTTQHCMMVTWSKSQTIVGRMNSLQQQ